MSTGGRRAHVTGHGRAQVSDRRYAFKCQSDAVATFSLVSDRRYVRVQVPEV